jgi:hypothetical protein
MNYSCHCGGRCGGSCFTFGLRAMLDREFDRDVAREREHKLGLEEVARRLGGDASEA